MMLVSGALRALDLQPQEALAPPFQEWLGSSLVELGTLPSSTTEPVKDLLFAQETSL